MLAEGGASSRCDYYTRRRSGMFWRRQLDSNVRTQRFVKRMGVAGTKTGVRKRRGRLRARSTAD